MNNSNFSIKFKIYFKRK